MMLTRVLFGVEDRRPGNLIYNSVLDVDNFDTRVLADALLAAMAATSTDKALGYNLGSLQTATKYVFGIAYHDSTALATRDDFVNYRYPEIRNRVLLSAENFLWFKYENRRPEMIIDLEKLYY